MRVITGSLGVPIVRQLRVGVFVQRWERFSADRPYETTRAGVEMTVGRANLSPRGIFLSNPGR